MLSGSLYLFLSKIAGYGIRIILPVFLVRILTKEEFGVYSQFFLLEMLIKTIFQMGINQSLFFFIPRDRENSGAYFVNSLILNVLAFSLAYSLVWVFRAQIAQELGMGLVHTYFWYLAWYSMLMMLNIAAEVYLTAREKILSASIYAVVREVLASIATLYAAFRYGELEKIFLALIVSRAVTLVLALLYIHIKLHGFRATRYFFGLGSQIKYGLVLGLAGTIWALTMRIHEMAVSREFDLATYAVYAAGCKQIPILQFFGQSVAVVALSKFAKLEKAQDWAGIRKLWDQILGSMYGVGIPVTLGFLLISKPLIILMFTENYAGAIPIFQVQTIAMFSLVLNPPLILRAMNRNDISLKVSIVVLVLMPFSFYLGAQYWGLMGVVSAYALLTILGKVASQFFLNRLAPIHLPYIASRASILDFYRETWYQTLDLTKKMGKILP
jgi:O-antigen/teichoic acid export membrane protein